MYIQQEWIERLRDYQYAREWRWIDGGTESKTPADETNLFSVRREFMPPLCVRSCRQEKNTKFSL